MENNGLAQRVADGAKSPATLTILLLIVAALLGACLNEMFALGHQFERGLDQALRDNDKIEREVRILGVHMENTNAILIREGIEKPGDREGAGPTEPKK